ncbi:MAG TPA: nucleotidyltransferase [Anaerovoracaceae bacterium]|nr:nucleotidyltransferase [Anaerovoracaceae bacterium]
MSTVGIVSEYNPFHKGHLYHIYKSKELTSADKVICVMSGNFVQRGMPSILPKEIRARHAIMNGADLVIEIPMVYSVASSDIFAKAGVSILEALNCEYISFGSECGDIDRLKEVSNNLLDERLDEYIKSFYGIGINYPKAREIAYNELFNDKCELLNKPNNILGLEYLKFINFLKPVTVKRVGSDYNSLEINSEKKYQSATAIRSNLYEGSDISNYVPQNTLNDLNYENKVNLNNYFNLIKYRILIGDINDFENCPSGGEGLGNKLKNEINNVDNLEDLIENVKSKRYTRTRICRLLVQVLIDIDRKYINYDKIGYIKPLAFNDRGAKILNNSQLKVISNINKIKHSDIFDEYSLEKEILSTDIYNLISGRNLYKNSEKVLKPQFIDF